MQKAPVLKASGLAPVEDEPVHVFGSNLEQRVVESKGDENKSKDDKDQESIKEDDVETIKRRKFDAITGEEEEETIFQGDFKLFAWCLDTSNWIEKGRGQLKLNDSVKTDQNRSRLIMRTGGTYRIVLNVAIKHSFFKVISNTKTNIRFTDSLTVWAASGSNAGQLADLIKERLEEDAKSAPIESNKTPTDTTKSETRETETPTDETKPEPEEDKPASKEPGSPPKTTSETADESKTPTDKTDSPAKDGTPPSSDETKSPVDETDSTPAVEIKSPAEDTIDNNKSLTESKTDDSKSSPEVTKSTVAEYNSASRRHSGTSDELDESELGKKKKLKNSSD